MTMSRSLVPLFLIFVSPAAQAQQAPAPDRTAELLANARQLVAVDADGCLINEDPDEILVCANADPNREHRLPLPGLIARTTRERVLLPQGNPEIIQQGRCYVTLDERNCFKGVPLLSVAFGGAGSGVSVSGPARELWTTIQPEDDDVDYVKEAQIKAATPE